MSYTPSFSCRLWVIRCGVVDLTSVDGQKEQCSCSKANRFTLTSSPQCIISGQTNIVDHSLCSPFFPQTQISQPFLDYHEISRFSLIQQKISSRFCSYINEVHICV